MKDNDFKDLLTSIGQVREIHKGNMICSFCERNITKEMVTKDGKCIWCDTEYHQSKKEK